MLWGFNCFNASLKPLDNILGFKIENQLRIKKKNPLLPHKGTNSHLQK